jgi:hypothetical protein
MRKWLWLGASAGLVVYCCHYWPIGTGAKLYLSAGQCMWDRLPLQQCDKFFTYPPAIALMMVPLLALPTWLINVIWYSVTLAAIVACFRLSVTLVRRAIPGPWADREVLWLYLIGIVLSLKFLFAASGNQSYDPVVVVLVLGGLHALSSDRPGWGGMAFGVAAALKVTPLLFLPYLVFTRRFTAAATMAVAVTVASLLPDLFFTQSVSGGYFATWIANIGGPAWTEDMANLPHIFWSGIPGNNYSLRGLVGYFMNDGNPEFRMTLDVVYAIYATIVAAIVLRCYRQPWAITTDGALLLLSMLMMSPMTSLSHFPALILFFVLLAAVWLQDDSGLRTVAGFFLLFVFVTTNLASDDLVGKTIAQWINENRVMTIGVLALAIFSAIYADRRVRREVRHLARAEAARVEPQPG